MIMLISERNSWKILNIFPLTILVLIHFNVKLVKVSANPSNLNYNIINKVTPNDIITQPSIYSVPNDQAQNSSKHKSFVQKFSEFLSYFNLFTNKSVDTDSAIKGSKPSSTYLHSKKDLYPGVVPYNILSKNKTMIVDTVNKFNHFKGFFSDIIDAEVIDSIVNLFHPNSKKTTSGETLEKQEEIIDQDSLRNFLNLMENVYTYGKDYLAVAVLLAIVNTYIVALVVSFPMVAVVFAAVYFPTLDLDDL